MEKPTREPDADGDGRESEEAGGRRGGFASTRENAMGPGRAGVGGALRGAAGGRLFRRPNLRSEAPVDTVEARARFVPYVILSETTLP
jgi:hypothetical protein